MRSRIAPRCWMFQHAEENAPELAALHAARADVMGRNRQAVSMKAGWRGSTVMNDMSRR
jgi:hypothetical protein